MASIIGRTARAQLTLIQMVTCTIAVLISGITYGLFAHYDARHNAVQGTMDLAASIANISQSALRFKSEADAHRILQAFQTRKCIRAAYIYDAEGNVFAEYTQEGATLSPYLPPLYDVSHIFIDGFVRVYHPIAIGEDILGTVCIEDSLSSVAASNKRHITTQITVMAISLLIAFLLAAKLQNIISRPILGLAQIARGVTEDSDYSRRATVAGSEEICALNSAFNEMLQAIQHRDRHLSNEIAERRRAEEELRDHKAILETLVANRTQELKRANEDLRREVQEHERSERRLQRTLMNLERTNSELERFAQVATHDLQEPLRKMIAFSGRLRESKEGGLDPIITDYLDRIMRSAKQMQFLIHDLLAFSILARRKPIFRTINMSAVVNQVIKDLQYDIDETQAIITVSDLPTIEAERSQMFQMFRHLISNAIKFRSESATPKLEIFSMEGTSNLVTIYVRDNGMGFEQKYESRIFEIFQQLHARHAYKGTGMGLAICKRIAEVHGATLSALSEPGQGTTFKLNIPREQTFDPTI